MGMMSRPGHLGPVAATEADWQNRQPAKRTLRRICPPSCYTHSILGAQIQLWECSIPLPCTDILLEADEGRERGLAPGPALLLTHTLDPHDGADPDATLARNERSSVATPASFLTQHLTQPCAPSLVNDTRAVRASQTVPRRAVYTNFSCFPTALLVYGHTLSVSELIK